MAITESDRRALEEAIAIMQRWLERDRSGDNVDLTLVYDLSETIHRLRGILERSSANPVGAQHRG